MRQPRLYAATCMTHLLACIHWCRLQSWLKLCWGSPACRKEGNTHKTYSCNCTENWSTPILTHWIIKVCAFYVYVVPTSAGLGTDDASFLDGEWKGEFRTTLWSIGGFRPGHHHHEEYITFLIKTIQSSGNGNIVNLLGKCCEITCFSDINH